MKQMVKRWISVLLVVCLSLALAPAAMMEEAIEVQEEVVGIDLSEPVEAQEGEPVEDAAPVEAEISIDAVDDVVTEEAYFSLDDAIELDGDEVTASDSAQMAALTSADFEDEAFWKYLLKNFDEDADGQLSQAEADAVEEIHVTGWGVTSLRGIEHFKNLTFLDCHSLDSTSFTSLDVSDCVNLTKLWCYYNKLTKLDVSGCVNLVELNCSGNQLPTLDVSDCSNLTGLQCWSNELTKLDVSGCANLTYLYCHDNQLPKLDVSDCVNLVRLTCYNNQLTVLDVSDCVNLKELQCSNSQLITLNASNCANLSSLSCGGNKLTKLDVSGCTNLTYLYCYDNQLPKLDVSDCVNLEELTCYNNQLPKLDVSNCVNLARLYCENNQLSTLDVSDCPLIAGIIESDNYTLSNDKKTVKYLSDVYIAYILQCDATVQIVGGKPVTSDDTAAPVQTPTATVTATPAAPTAAPAAPTIPVISALKKSSKATLMAAPGTFAQLDWGGVAAKKFKSSKKKVATVNGAGLITIKAAGKTKISFKVGKKTRTVTLTVKDPTIPAFIALNLAGSVPAQVGVPQTLTVTLPEGTNSGIKWKTSNKKVATVKNGVVTFKKAGKVTITATATRGKKKAKVKFVVSK